MSRIKHIDGLRAIAIFPVVLYHAFPAYFPNGYLGVDYFLVISGFVISKKYIIDSIDEFSFYSFWSRRFRRLYPQLLCCIFICLPIAWVTMHPDHLENFSQSSIASILGANNILLFITGGYWNLANELKPLFPTWSLGLEEQFYLLFAIILLSLQKFHNKKVLFFQIFAVLLFLSLVSSAFGAIYFQTFNYLLLPSRIWEFSLGIFASLFFSHRKYSPSSFLTNLSFVLIICFAFFFPFSTANYAPNPFLLFPLLAICLICISKANCIATYILSTRLVVYIGLSSYAIYLYHQPLLAFARLSSFNGPSNSTLSIIVFASFIVGFVMYELVERERLLQFFKLHRPSIITPIKLFVSSVFIALVNFIIVLNQGFFSFRFPYMLINGKPPIGFLGGKGYTDLPYVHLGQDFASCNSSTRSAQTLSTRNIFLIGNSKTRDLINTLSIIDSSHSHLNFCYSYSDGSVDMNYLQKLLNKADIIFVQIHNQSDSVPESSLADFKHHLSKIVWHKDREKFAKNITPIMFEKDLKLRASYKVLSTDSYFCTPENVLTLNTKPSKHGIAFLDTQCAFNSNDGMKLLTSDNGTPFTFDGIHLTEAGAKHLAKNIMDSHVFSHIFLDTFTIDSL